MLIEFPLSLSTPLRLYFVPPFQDCQNETRLITVDNDALCTYARIIGYILMCIHRRNPSTSVYIQRGNDVAARGRITQGPCFHALARAWECMTYQGALNVHKCTYCTIIEAYQFRFSPSDESCTATTDNEIDTGNPYSRETHALPVSLRYVISSAYNSNEPWI